jgi:hypothetical protein
MRIPGKIGYKLFFLSKPSSESRSESEAITAVIAPLLLLVIAVALAGTVANVCDFSGSGAFSQIPVAKVTLESYEGGLSHAQEGENATFENNTMMLTHEGGSFLPLDTTSIRISGKGNCYQGVFGAGKQVTGDVEVFYQNLSPKGKNPKYKSRNKKILEDNCWSVGEKLILYGNDSSVSSIVSSVKASVNGDYNTSDNYGFKVGSEITLKVIDTKSNNIISEQIAVVKHADG